MLGSSRYFDIFQKVLVVGFEFMKSNNSIKDLTSEVDSNLSKI